MTTTVRKLRNTLLASLFAASTASLSLAAPAHADDDGDVDVEGAIGGIRGECPNLSFTVGNTNVRTDDRTEFDDTTCQRLAVGDRVEVEGLMQADGTILAREVDLDG